jgi:hypothetical protein
MIVGKCAAMTPIVYLFALVIGERMSVLKTAPGRPPAADDASVAHHPPLTVTVGHKVRQPAPV